MKYDLLNQLLNIYVDQEGFRTSGELAEMTGVSEKTIRKYTNYLKEELQGNGADLEILQGSGSRLVIKDRTLFSRYYNQTIQEKEDVLSSPSARKAYVLMRLLTSQSGIDVYDLAEKMYISPSLTRSILREIRDTAELYNLKLSNSYRSGYRMEGNEKDIRRCLVSECRDVSNMKDYLAGDRLSGSETAQLSGMIEEGLEKFGVVLSDKAVAALALHFMIALNRTEAGNVISLESNTNLSTMRGTPEFFITSSISRRIEERFHIRLPENELLYLAMHISAKQRYYDHQKLQFRTSEEDLIFYNTFLRNIYKMADIDFFEDEELRVTLMNHIIPFRKRVVNDLQIRKSELSDIRKEFPYAYELALYGLSMYPEGTVQPAEVAYFAIHLELSLEKRRLPERQCSIAIICNETASLYQIAAFKLQRAFSSMIRSIRFVELSDYEKDRRDLDLNTDLVLNMTGKKLDLSVPVLSISTFITDGEMQEIREELVKAQETGEIQKLAGSSLFMRLSGLQTRDEVMDEMIVRIGKNAALPGDFRARLEAREAMEATELADGIAVPHPIGTAGIPDLLAVAVLDQPVRWSQKDVSIVFMMVSSHSAATDWIMGRISKINDHPGLLETLKNAETYIDFMKIFMQI